MDSFMLPFIVLMLSTFTARVINNHANKKLSQEKKAELIDIFSKSQTLTFGLIIGIVGVYFLIIEYHVFEPLISSFIYIGLLLVFFMYQIMSGYKRLNQHDYSRAFIQSYLIASSIRLLGILIFCGILIGQF